MKSLKSILDEWLEVICWSSLLLGIFMIKQCVVFSLIVLGTLKVTSTTKLFFAIK